MKSFYKYAVMLMVIPVVIALCLGLEDVSEPIRGPYTSDHCQDYTALTDNTLTTLVGGAAGKQIEVYSFLISSDTNANFTIYSGTNVIFVYYSNWGSTLRSTDMPLFVTAAGEALKIQSSEAALNASIYVQYKVE